MSSAPAHTMSQPAPPRPDRSVRPVTRAPTASIVIDAARALSNGQKPAPFDVSLSRTNTAPKPTPATTAGVRGVGALADARSGSWADRLMNPTATTATRTPTIAAVDGRSPRATSPQATGTTAAPTAVIGATTLMRPMARPW